MWQLIRNLGLVEAGESVCCFSFCLSWKTSEYPSGLCLEEATLVLENLLLILDGEEVLVQKDENLKRFQSRSEVLHRPHLNP